MNTNDSDTASSDGRMLDLAGRLQSAALEHLPTRGEAATALMTAALAILVDDLGCFAGVEVLQSALDEAAALHRANLH